MKTEQELREGAEIYFSPTNKVVFATTDGNYFLADSLSHARAHRATLGTQLYEFTQEPEVETEEEPETEAQPKKAGRKAKAKTEEEPETEKEATENE